MQVALKLVRRTEAQGSLSADTGASGEGSPATEQSTEQGIPSTFADSEATMEAEGEGREVTDAAETAEGGRNVIAEQKEAVGGEEGDVGAGSADVAAGAAGAEAAAEKIVVDESNLPEYAGQPVFQNEKFYEHTPVGVVMGLAWTAMGGSTLYVESTVVDEVRQEWM